jgi:hypothetical protein
MPKRSEPSVQTDAELAEVLSELMEHESVFHWPEPGTARNELERMMAAEFWEVGASGRSYGRDDALAELVKRATTPQPDAWETSDLRCQRLGEDVYLLTYTLQDGNRLTRRSTIWLRTAEGWKVVFHQGTTVQGA